MWKKFFSRQVIIVSAVVVVIFLLNFLGLSRPLKQWSQEAFAWFSEKMGSRHYYFASNFADCPELVSQHEELQNTLGRLTIEKARLETLEDENRRLREYFNFLETNKQASVFVNIVARESLPGLIGQEQNLIIDRGSSHGLVPGLAVINETGAIIGKITDTKEASSRVCLVTSRSCRLAATILNIDRTAGLTEGERGLTIVMELIPQGEEIVPDDLVITSGLEDLIPRGLVIGRVTRVDKRSNEIWQSAVIEPAVPLSDLSILAVILP